MLPNPIPTDQGPDVPPVPTPDLAQTAKLEAVGTRQSGIVAYYVAGFFSVLINGLQGVLTILASVFDDIAALLTAFFTAAQGQDTPGFNRLVAAVLSDTLGVEVSAADLQQSQFESGRVGAMQRVGADLFNTLGNEFIGGSASSEPGSGIGGLPGTPGVKLTPEQGVKAAQSFLGFALSFAVRQGNVAFLSSALPWEWLGGIREYGEMMAKNLGLGRLVRRALQPYIQTLIQTPLQEALNRQYRPRFLEVRQIAAAFIRSEIDRSDYVDRLAALGYSDKDIEITISDTYTRMHLEDVFLLEQYGIIGSDDAQNRVTALGFNTSDVGLLRQARELRAVHVIDREYIKAAEADLHAGLISQATFNADLDGLHLSQIEKDALRRNASNRVAGHAKHLSLGFLKRAFIDGQITIDALMQHILALGFSQDDADIIEVEVLLQSTQHKAAAAAKAAKLAQKAAGKNPPKPPTVP